VYNLQLAKRLGLSKSKANISNLHSCLDVTTSFVIYVKRFLMHRTPYARDDKRVFLNALWANISPGGSRH